MENRKVKFPQGVVTSDMRKQVEFTHEPKWQRSPVMANRSVPQRMDTWASGLLEPPKCPIIIQSIELGKPFVVLKKVGTLRREL